MLSNFMNKPGGRISKSQQDEVLRLIRDNDRAVTVVDCGKELEDSFVVDLCHALCGNRFVATLRIRDRELGGAVEALAQLISRTTTLVTLKLSYANLTDHDMPFILGPLIKNRSIQHLSIDHNNITDAESIKLLITHNKNLDSLDLSFNNLGKDGDRSVLAIADALGNNASLKQLYLSGNGISDVAARRLVEVLDENLHKMRLRVLDIAAENSVRSETKEALKLVLEAGRQLQQQNGDDGDDLRSHLTGFRSAAARGGDSAAVVPAVSGAHGAASNADGVSAAGDVDVEAWRHGVDIAGSASQFDDERRELQAIIDALREEKEQATKAQIAALEQANKMQQRLAVLSEANSGVQRELDMVTTKYDKKVKESAEAVDNLRDQLTAARKELVRQQEAASADRATLLTLQESLTEELSRVHEQLAAATQANDLREQVAPPAARRRPTAEREVLTDLSGFAARTALQQQHQALVSAGRHPGGSSGTPSAVGGVSNVRGGGANERDPDAWSESTADVSGVPNAGARRAHNAPMPMPRDQWMDDDAAHDCKSCRREFTMTRRKHHCRICGQLFCSNCCAVHKQWDMRVCTYCLATHGH